MDQILEEQEGELDPSTLIRLACLSDDVFADDEDDLSAWKSSTKNIDVSTKVNADLVASLIARLRTRVVELEGECDSLSVSTGDGIANAMSEYRTIISSCSDIQRSVNDMSASMQRLGTDFSERIQALVELDVAHCRMKETKAVIGLAGEILGILRRIYVSMNEGDMYHAAKMYRSAYQAYTPSLEAAAKNGWQEDGHGSGDGAWDIREESSFMRSHLGYIAPFLLKRLEEIEDRLDQQVSSMMKEWLAYAGHVAEKVGVDAMKLCDEYHMYCAKESKIRKKCFDDVSGTEDDDEQVQIVMDAIMEASHKDGNKMNNHWTNLEYLTHAENIAKSFREHGRINHWTGKKREPFSEDTKKKMALAKNKPVVANTGEIWGSIDDCATALDTYRKAIYNAIRHKRKLKKNGLRLQFVTP